MILLVVDYSYNDGGVTKGSYYQILIYFQDGKFYRKAKEFNQDPNNVYPNHGLPKITVLAEQEVADYVNILPVGKKLLFELIKDNEYIFKFYKNPYKNIHSFVLTKIMKPYQIDW